MIESETTCITCAECKFYEPKSDYDIRGIVVGRCLKVKMFWDCTEWKDVGGDYVRVSTDATQKFFVQDGSDYSASLLPTPEFGCNQGEKK